MEERNGNPKPNMSGKSVFPIEIHTCPEGNNVPTLNIQKLVFPLKQEDSYSFQKLFMLVFNPGF